MSTQTIKSWLHKLFAWWPWKQSTQVEHTHTASPLNKGAKQESISSRSTVDGAAPQTGIVPRLSTIEERPENSAPPQFPATGERTESPLALPPPAKLEKTVEREVKRDEAAPAVASSPTPEQRLDFLRYLVQRGIVNEGFEEHK